MKYIQCSECGHEFEVEKSEDGMVAFADGMLPDDETVDSFTWHIFHKAPNGNECEASLTVPRQ